MAPDAVPCLYRTDFASRCTASRSSGLRMAGEATGVICGGFFHQRLVRIVTGCALNAFVSWAPASAPGETIRLKPHTLQPRRANFFHLERGTVAAAAEFIHGLWRHLGRIDDFWHRCSSLH